MKSLSRDDEQLKKLKELPNKTRISEAKLIRLVLEEFFKNRERLNKILGRAEK